MSLASQPATPAPAPDGPSRTTAKPAPPQLSIVSSKSAAAPLPAFARPKNPHPAAPKSSAPHAAFVQHAIDFALPRAAATSTKSHSAILLKMPEAPSTLSPTAQARFRKTQAAAAHTAVAQATLPPVKDHVEDARLAVTEPTEQANADAAAAVVVHLDKREPPSPDIEKLCLSIFAIIRDQRPKDEDELVKANPDQMARTAGTSVQGSVDTGMNQVHQGYSSLDRAPVGTPSQIGLDIPQAPAALSTAPANAAQAVPDAIPAKNVDLHADTADSQARIDQAGMSTAPAQLAQSGPIAEARTAQGDLAQTAAEDPAKVLADQNATLLKASSDMAGLEQSSLAMLHTTRSAASSHVYGQKKQMVGSEESMRREAGTKAQTHFEQAQTEVNGKLLKLKETALGLWKAGVDSATLKFKTVLKAVDDWIKERHSGWLVGRWHRLRDWARGLPPEVKETYDEAELTFGYEICKAAREISSQVNTVVAACEARIAQANQDIATDYAALEKTSGKWVEAQKAQFGVKLANLSQHAHEVRDDFNKELIQNATEAVQDVHNEVQELREKAKGIIGKIGDAIQVFLKDPAKFIINALLSLLGISPASFWALVAKIKHVIGQIADDPVQFAKNLMSAIAKGFRQFFGNFTTHLFKGFINWLTRGLAAVGVEVPKDTSLPSILTFMLQLMGITWPRIRERLAKLVGEKNVALVEKVFSTVATLIELGPAGIFEMIKHQLDPHNILDMIIDAAVSFMESAVVTAVAEKVLMLFVPGGAILEAIEGIYKVLKWIVHNAANIFTLIETIVNGIADILSGNIAGMANAIEKALAMLIPPVIDFLANFFSLGDLPEKVHGTIAGFQEKVMGALDSVLKWMIEKGKGLLAAIGIGKKEEPAKGPDARTEEEKTKAKHAALDEAVALLPNDDFDEDSFRPKLLPIKSIYRLLTLDLVVDSETGDSDTVHFTASASSEIGTPKKKVKTSHIVKNLKIPSRRSWAEDTLTIHAEESEDLHKKGSTGKVRKGKSGTPLLKKGYARRHIISSKDMAEHYETELNKKSWADAKVLLENTGGAEARAAGKVTGKLSNKTIHEAAKRRHLAFFNWAENHFVGPSRKNSQIGRNFDPDHPEMLTQDDLQAHADMVKAEWAIDMSVSMISGAKGLVDD